jgi:hypothetical protein
MATITAVGFGVVLFVLVYGLSAMLFRRPHGGVRG